MRQKMLSQCRWVVLKAYMDGSFGLCWRCAGIAGNGLDLRGSPRGCGCGCGGRWKMEDGERDVIMMPLLIASIRK
jgi:hypothetical protein